MPEPFIVKGTSLLRYIKPDFAIPVTGSDLSKVKASVRRALIERKINALYLPA